jgi:beta-lactamase class A
VFRHVLLSLCAALLACSAAAHCGDLEPAPDPALQPRLEEIARSRGWDEPLGEGRLAIALVVIEADDAPHLAMLNGRRMLYAASLPKVAILFGVLEAAQEGELEIDPALAADLQAMIRQSCNPCATRALDRLGRERLLEILQRPEYGFYDGSGHGGLWVGKDYSGSPAHRRDPLRGISHGATAFQAARLLYRLETGDLLDAKHSRMMLDALSEPGIRHKFVAALSPVKDLQMWRKSGTWREFHADAALVRGDGVRYILVGLAEDPEGEQLLRDLATAVHQLVTAMWPLDPA